MLEYALGIFGHVDHGKTAFITYLSKKNPSRFKEEREKKISLNIGFSDFSLFNKRFIFLDSPGHKNLLFCPILISEYIDFAIFVVTPDLFFPMQQTVDHLKIVLTYLPPSRIFFLQTKCDLYTLEENESFKEKILFFFDSFGLDKTNLFPFSISFSEEVVKDILESLFSKIGALDQKKKTTNLKFLSSLDPNKPKTEVTALAGGVFSSVSPSEASLALGNTFFFWPKPLEYKTKKLPSFTIKKIKTFSGQDVLQTKKNTFYTFETDLDPFFFKKNKLVGYSGVYEKPESSTRTFVLDVEDQEGILFYFSDFFKVYIKNKIVSLSLPFLKTSQKSYLFLKPKSVWVLTKIFDL